MGYLSIYEKELRLKFERGKLVESETIDNVEKIEYFINLPQIYYLKKKWIENGCSEEHAHHLILRMLEKVIIDGAFNDPEFKTEVFKGLPNVIAEPEENTKNEK